MAVGGQREQVVIVDVVMMKMVEGEFHLKTEKRLKCTSPNTR